MYVAIAIQTCVFTGNQQSGIVKNILIEMMFVYLHTINEHYRYIIVVG
jgi:hypothetical protein